MSDHKRDHRDRLADFIILILSLTSLILAHKVVHLNDWHKAGCAECADEEGKG